MDGVTLEKIYSEYHDKVTFLVRKKIGDPNETEDVVSDIFLKITKHLDRFDPTKASLGTWVFTIANRTILDYYRTRKLSVELPSESGEEGGFPEVLVDDTGLDSDLLKEEQLKELARALLQLKEKERDLIILFYYKEMTLKQAAETMGMSYANAKVLHKKALTKLGMLLQQ